jgi:hypothetical protein
MRCRVGYGLTAIVLMMPAIPRAETGPVLFYGSEHVLVDTSTSAGREYVARLGASRPTPLATVAPVVSGASLGNLHSPDTIGRNSCGSQSDSRLVLCMNEDGRLSYSDSLAALAFSSKPTTANVPDDATRQYLAGLLSRLPDPTRGTSVRIVTHPCESQCAHQIILEHKS